MISIPWHMLATSSFREESVEGVISHSVAVICWHLTIRVDACRLSFMGVCNLKTVYQMKVLSKRKLIVFMVHQVIQICFSSSNNWQVQWTILFFTLEPASQRGDPKMNHYPNHAEYAVGAFDVLENLLLTFQLIWQSTNANVDTGRCFTTIYPQSQARIAQCHHGYQEDCGQSFSYFWSVSQECIP